MPKQKITIEIDTHGDPPYSLIESKDGGDYEALRFFFEDIGIEVTDIKIEEVTV